MYSMFWANASTSTLGTFLSTPTGQFVLGFIKEYLGSIILLVNKVALHLFVTIMQGGLSYAVRSLNDWAGIEHVRKKAWV